MNSSAGQVGPQFVRYFGPVLDALRDLGDSARPAEVRDKVAVMLNVPDETQEELLGSGAPRFDNQINWARFYLARAGSIDSSQRGVWSLTDKGRVSRLSHKEALDIFREVQSGFQEAQRKAINEQPDDEDSPPGEETEPRANTRQMLLDTLLSLPPGGFERFCQRPLREYGFQDVTVTGRSGDGGIDGIGILRVNALVSFKVLFQCKRYQGSVNPGQIRDFRGAMQGRADKGIFITTGAFSTEAKREAVRDGVPPIELVDGVKLVEMLEELELGVVAVRTFRVDRDFFDDFQ